jgi:N-methylhydantoinase A
VTPAEKSYRIAIDTGGTFSDIVVSDKSGRLVLTKALTTPDRIFEGISEAIGYAALELGLADGDELLAATDVLIYATTRSTNAILTEGTARTALLTTAGFGDLLIFREGGKLRPFDFRQAYPEPYIPRHLTFELDERTTSEGAIAVPLRREDVAARLTEIEALGVEAIAVSLLWSIANPAHEELIGEVIAEQLPDIPFTLSHQLNPIIREYRRTSSAAIDASLKPLMQAHLTDMEADLRAAGFAGELLIVTSFGGVLSVDEVRDRPIYSVNSGPAMAPIAAKAAAAPLGDLIVCDTGGTSFDVSVVDGGEPSHTRETWLGELFTGHITGLSSVDVKNVGAGGGSIAWIDGGGLIRVGPQSAGSRPGPACYGLGGTEPTVTDACVVLGYIDPDYFLGGRMSLDREAARRAVAERIAEPLGLPVQRAAWAILAIANERMVTAVKDITISQGIDPRDSTLVAGGGAGGMTMAMIADELGCDRVLVPPTVAGLSACGGLYSDIVKEFILSVRTDSGDFDYEGVNAALAQLDSDLDAFFDQFEVEGDVRVKQFIVEARYRYQIWELDIPLAGPFEGPDDVARMVEDFHATHERLFAVREPEQRVECLVWKARATVRRPDPERRPRPVGVGEAEAKSRRLTWWGDDEPVEVGIYAGLDLARGAKVSGPAVVELPTTTVVVYPRWQLEVDEADNFHLQRNGSEAA